jgi:hypothetical protein
MTPSTHPAEWKWHVILAALLPAVLAPGCRSATAVERPFLRATVSLRGLSLPYAVYLPPRLHA